MRVEPEALGEIRNYALGAAEPWLRRWVVEDREYVRCTGSILNLVGFEDWPRLEWPTLRNVTFERLTLSNRRARLKRAVLDNVTFNGVNFEISASGCVMRHVTLAGRMPNPSINWSRDVPYDLSLFEGVDWALDVSELRSKEVLLRGVPPDKVRIDPLRQVFVTRASLKPEARLIESLAGDGLVTRSLRRFVDGQDHPQFVLPGYGEVNLYQAYPSKKYDEANDRETIALLYEHGLALPTAPLDTGTGPTIEPVADPIPGPGPAIRADYIAVHDLDELHSVMRGDIAEPEIWPASYGSIDPTTDLESLVTAVNSGAERAATEPETVMLGEAVAVGLSEQDARRIARADDRELERIAHELDAELVDLGGPTLQVLADLATWLRRINDDGRRVYALVFP